MTNESTTMKSTSSSSSFNGATDAAADDACVDATLILMKNQLVASPPPPLHRHAQKRNNPFARSVRFVDHQDQTCNSANCAYLTVFQSRV
jgi:hypothetical protein